MIDDFLLRAGLAGFGIALLTAPLGCFVVWQRLAMFGNSIAHCACSAWRSAFCSASI